MIRHPTFRATRSRGGGGTGVHTGKCNEILLHTESWDYQPTSYAPLHKQLITRLTAIGNMGGSFLAKTKLSPENSILKRKPSINLIFEDILRNERKQGKKNSQRKLRQGRQGGSLLS